MVAWWPPSLFHFCKSYGVNTHTHYLPLGQVMHAVVICVCSLLAHALHLLLFQISSVPIVQNNIPATLGCCCCCCCYIVWLSRAASWLAYNGTKVTNKKIQSIYNSICTWSTQNLCSTLSLSIHIRYGIG